MCNKPNTIVMAKYKYIKVLKANYGYGWEDEITYDQDTKQSEIRSDIADYRRNAPQFDYKVITRRVKL